ncbi:hypothetical protein BDW74DRAFT_183951 [Aspergillus multicolor]|uniref:uncharacterized protein n=1 Tax=Aspergillus multicolor TaxID=41759 RepID=UPI003CCCB107
MRGAPIRRRRGHQYVTLKIYTRDEVNKEEFQVYEQLNKGGSWHPGYAPEAHVGEF